MKIIAHTGCMGTKMNSRESILAGIQEQADYIEVDVRFLGDRAVLTHDRPELGNEYLSLEEAVRLVRDAEPVRLALDLKEWDRIGEVAALLESMSRTVSLVIESWPFSDAGQRFRFVRPGDMPAASDTERP